MHYYERTFIIFAKYSPNIRSSNFTYGEAIYIITY